MRGRQRDTSLGEGVYFAHDDYVGMMSRVVILVVDFAVLVAAMAVFCGIGFLISVIFDEKTAVILGFVFFLAYLVFVWIYLTVLKTSSIRTVGYWVTGSRIVNLRGERPSFFRMTFRELFWIVGPISLLFDLMWSGIDDDRQMLRDRYAGTCVVKYHAEPIGSAEIHLNYYNAMGFALAFPRVMAPVGELNH